VKTMVSVQEISEIEIKPPAEVAEWLRLVEGEIASRWRDRSGWSTVSCPCCGESAGTEAFVRAGIGYRECSRCATVYAPTRPPEAELTSWYKESEASRFWRERILAASADARRDKILRPRAQWVLDGIAEYRPASARVVDVSGDGGAVVEEIAAASPTPAGIVTAAPTSRSAQPNGRISAKPGSTREIARHGPADVVTAFDAFDRAADLAGLVRAIHETLKPGGLLFAAMPVSSGFELQALWERSTSVAPPDKLNLPSVAGLMRMFAAPEWELLELSTPGMFDVELVSRAIAKDPGAPWPRVVRSLVAGADAPARESLTEYLQMQRLTSFARLVARRTD